MTDFGNISALRRKRLFEVFWKAKEDTGDLEVALEVAVTWYVKHYRLPGAVVGSGRYHPALVGVCESLGLKPKHIVARTRNKQAEADRKQVILALCDSGRYSQSEVARIVERDHSVIHHVLKNRQNQPKIDTCSTTPSSTT